MNRKSINSLANVASKLQSDPEQSLIFERFLPASEVLEVCKKFGHRFRDRIYSPVVTVWMFLGQTLSPDHSCRDAVHRLNAWRVARGKKKADSNTTSYCEARQRLPEEVAKELAIRSGQKCQQHAAQRWRWKGHDVKVVDGFTLTMPDSTANQEEYPQQRSQKQGCGFPIMRCVMLFCLSTGAALDIATGRYRGKQTGENSLFQMINQLFSPGDILLADRYYASYGNIYHAIKEGYHVVMRSHHKRKIDFRRGFKQGSYDQIIAYHKPIRRPVWMSQSEHQECEAFILVRHVSYEVKRKGFRVKRIILATTMLDANQYTVEDLADLYCRVPDLALVADPAVFWPNCQRKSTFSLHANSATRNSPLAPRNPPPATRLPKNIPYLDLHPAPLFLRHRLICFAFASFLPGNRAVYNLSLAGRTRTPAAQPQAQALSALQDRRCAQSTWGPQRISGP